MKNIYKLLSIAIFGIAISSCSGDWLNLSPGDSIEAGESITDYNSAKIALTGMYDALQGSSTAYNDKSDVGPTYYGARMIYYGDVKADNMQATPNGSRTILTYDLTFSLNNAPQIWSVPYTVIERANHLIYAIDHGKVIDATDNKTGVDDLLGQALAARALAHFDLVRIYGDPYIKSQGKSLGIPIVLEPKTGNYKPGRNTVEEVYTQVIKDLTDAISLLKADKSKGYINKWAAQALLARVYLYKQDYTNAYKTATEVINTSPYTLWSTEEYPNVWSQEGTSEMLFEIVNYDSNDWVDREAIGYIYNESGYGAGVMTKAYLDMVDKNYPDDIRRSLMKRSNLADTTAAIQYKWGINPVYTAKYPGRGGSNDVRINNIPVLRLSETYLIASEAAFNLGDNANATKYLNAIVLRGNPKAKPVSASEISLDRILQENSIEFIAEGHRFFDLIRNGKTITRYTNDSDIGWHLPLSQEARSFTFNYYKTLMPIPLTEVNTNPTIAKQQNPGYPTN